MATSSILGGERAPVQAEGRDIDVLGPSDTSDSGSDVQGERGFDALGEGEVGADQADLSSDTDASGTGERGAAVHDSDIVEGADIAPDRIGVIRGGNEAVDDGDAGTMADIDSLTADADTGDDDDDDEEDDDD